MVLPEARLALERGVEEKRFRITDPSVALSAIVGGALAVMRGILDGRLGPGAEVADSEGVLRMLGVAGDEVEDIARRANEAVAPT